MAEQYFFGYWILKQDYSPWARVYECDFRSPPWGREDEEDIRPTVLNKLIENLNQEELANNNSEFNVTVDGGLIIFRIGSGRNMEAFIEKYNKILREIRNLSTFSKLGT